MLGAPSFNNFRGIEGSYGITLDGSHREKLLVEFIDRVRLFEIQGRLPYGPPLRVEDLFGGTVTGFLKILGAVERILRSLEDTYQDKSLGLYVVPSSDRLQVDMLIRGFVADERSYLNLLISMTESVVILVDVTRAPNTTLVELVNTLKWLLRYHSLVLSSLSRISQSEHKFDQDWNAVFMFNKSSIFAAACAAHTSCCAAYLLLDHFLENFHHTDHLVSAHAHRLHHLLSHPPRRFLEYRRFIEAIVSLTNPMFQVSYHTLVVALVKIQDVVECIEQVGEQVRSILAADIMQVRLSSSSRVDPYSLGHLLLDDHLQIDGSYFSVMVFEEMLLRCQDVEHSPAPGESLPILVGRPIPAWELGRALRRKTTLTVVDSIPIRNLSDYTQLDHCRFKLTWFLNLGRFRSLTFWTASPAQCSQWCSALRRFAMKSSNSVSSFDGPRVGPECDLFFSSPKSWNPMGRRLGSQSGVPMVVQDHLDHCAVLTPTLLPSLFYDTLVLEEPSNFSLSDGCPESGPDAKPESSQLPLDSFETRLRREFSGLPNITGQVRQALKYPSAYGGFADIWEGIWKTPTNERKVGVKVLRLQSRKNNSKDEENLKKNLRRELHVWRRLNHENIIPLHGVADDFGPYPSMVCPWMDNGSISKYIEHHGEHLSVSQRLKMLCEVCCGLSYREVFRMFLSLLLSRELTDSKVHSFSIIHGDLTGSNVLIDLDGKACLCDFGLSSIIAEFHGTSYYTSNIRGAVRWAAIELFRDEVSPTISIKSDIYSFGSLMLEVLSGKIPYHQLPQASQVISALSRGIKPSRPTDCPITDAHWHFIQRCWADNPEERPTPSSSLSTQIDAIGLTTNYSRFILIPP
ncbi:hypothetical protein JAAARDRAFT_196591 [Jaapia argillacea MUCL 33604]|uniref:Protein kinase domain-containing protein n=1 Tax=Jaapia argillacea MUCL 33604 TaxID=933084 RepID=A0A067PIG7_9AGAM|nr:hypothetical protein JAAARDRAFT_196591 [Jaapia argillacea MUCL 33604]